MVFKYQDTFPADGDSHWLEDLCGQDEDEERTKPRTDDSPLGDFPAALSPLSANPTLFVSTHKESWRRFGRTGKERQVHSMRYTSSFSIFSPSYLF